MFLLTGLKSLLGLVCLLEETTKRHSARLLQQDALESELNELRRQACNMVGRAITSGYGNPPQLIIHFVFLYAVRCYKKSDQLNRHLN